MNLLNSILYSLKYRGFNRPLKWITTYVILLFLINISSFILSKYHVNNLYLSHVYFIGQFVLLSLFHLSLEPSPKLIKFIKLNLILTPSILLIQYLLYPHLLLVFNEVEILLCNFSIFIYSLLYLFQSIGNNTRYMKINYGILIYLSFSTIIFCSGNLMVYMNEQVNKVIWIFNSFISFFFSIMLFLEWYGLYKQGQITEPVDKE